MYVFIIFLFQICKMMNADKDRLKLLLTETITLLCQRGLTFRRELHVQGLLGITVDDDVFLVPVNDRKSYSVKPPWFMNSEEEATSPCDLIPQQGEPNALHHKATSEVPDVNSDFLNAAGDTSTPLQYPAMDNESRIPTMVKAETPDVTNTGGSSENKIRLSGNRLNENLATTAQLQPASSDVRSEGKRKRKRCKFGNDMLVLSPDNDEWTDVSLREINNPVVGYSQWASYGEGLQHDISVSIFKSEIVACILHKCCYSYSLLCFM